MQQPNYRPKKTFIETQQNYKKMKQTAKRTNKLTSKQMNLQLRQTFVQTNKKVISQKNILKRNSPFYGW